MNMKKLTSFIVLLFVLFSPRVSFAAEKSWNISKWDTAIRINKDATFDVTDTVTFDFHGSFTFVTRSLDRQKFDSISDYEVADETGVLLTDISPLSYDTAQNAYTSTLHFTAQDESRTFTFRYTVHGGIGYFPDHDELYWNILPSARDVSVSAVHVLVTLPEKISEKKLQHAVYTEGADATSSVGDGSFEFSSGTVPAQKNFTIAAGWPIDVVANPGVYRIESNPTGADVYVNGEKAASATPMVLRGSGFDLHSGNNEIVLKKFGYSDVVFSIDPKAHARETVTHDMSITWWFPIFIVVVSLYFAHPLAVLVAMIIHWRRYGRDPKGRGTIIAQYEPPLHLPPTLVGVLLDERVDMHDTTATLIDLAYRGYIKIKELPKPILGQQDFELTRLKDFLNDSELRPYEQQFLKALFGDGKVTSLKEQREKFFSKIPAIHSELYQEATDLALFQENPEERRRKYALGGFALVVVGIFGMFLYALGVPLIVSGIIVVIFSRFMPRRTKKGVAALEYALGFKEYLFRAERYRVQKLTPEMFEKFLPYAMIFKIEKEWAKKFEGIYRGQPSWYESSHPLSGNPLAALMIVNSMDRFTTAAVQSFAATPGGGGSGASGMSGFSGGFSGGGGGGGGISAG